MAKVYPELEVRSLDPQFRALHTNYLLLASPLVMSDCMEVAMVVFYLFFLFAYHIRIPTPPSQMGLLTWLGGS